MSLPTDLVPKSFKLDPEVARALEDAARREQRTMTAIVERAIRIYVAMSRVNIEAAAPALEAAAAQE